MRHLTSSPRALAALIIIIGLTACSKSHEAIAEPKLDPIAATLAESRLVEIPQRIEVRGTVEAERSAAVSSRVTAMVTRLAVKSGDRVRRGQILVEIDPTTAQGQLSQASGALAQAQAALTLAERNYKRFQSLAATNAASELELDMARMQFEQATGAVEQAAGAVQAARSVAAESSVRAPFDGLVVRRMVDVGDLAAPGRPLMVIESEAARRLALAVPASVMARAGLAVGDVVTVRIDGHDELGEITSTVIEASSAADPITHSFDVKTDLTPVSVASGSPGRAWIEIATRTAVVVPASAVHRRGGLELVVIRTADGSSESRILTLGNRLPDGGLEVLSGLEGGETVVLGLGSIPATGTPIEELS